MTKNELIELIKQCENISVELKTCSQQVDHTVYESVCAFLNRLGGTIVMGVSDDGQVVGIEDKYIQKVQRSFVNAINNPEILKPTTYIIPEVVEMEEGKNVVVIHVPESHQVHQCKGHIFDRNDEGDMDITDNSYLVGLLYMRKLGYSTERRVIPEITMNDFDEATFEKTRRILWAGNHQHLWTGMKSEEILRTGGFWQRDPQTGKEGFLMAALLLWGKEQSILRHLPHFLTDAVYYSWPFKRQLKPTGDMGTTFYDDRLTLRCNLVEQFTLLMDFVRKNMRGKEIMDASGSGRIDLREIIFRELVANFLVHREYQAHYQGRLFIYQDRFVTENYTRVVQRGKLTIDNLVPNQKNPMLSHVFGIMKYYEGVGKGMARLREYLWKYNAGASVEFDNADLFRMTVLLPEENEITEKITVETPEITEKTPEITEKTEEITVETPEITVETPEITVETPEITVETSEITVETPDITEKILYEIQKNPQIRNQELSAIIGRSTDSIFYFIKKMKEQGILKRVGPNKGGHWEIVKKIKTVTDNK